MKQYLNLLKEILEKGKLRTDRTGKGTISIFATQMKIDISESFPLLTTKRTAFKAVKSELLWFLEGSTDERRLAEIHYGKPANLIKDKKTVWTANANEQGKALGGRHSDNYKDLGRVYGQQWVNWLDSDGFGIDQISNVINSIKDDPFSRRHVVNAWNVGDLNKMALPPCHLMFMFYVREMTEYDLNKYLTDKAEYENILEIFKESVLKEDFNLEDFLEQYDLPKGKLSCQFFMRSSDVFLGLPFNIASYAMLTYMIAQVTNLIPDELVYTGNDVHIYLDHLEQVKEQLSRKPLLLPKLVLNSKIKNIKDFTMEDISIKDYKYHPSIKAEMAV